MDPSYTASATSFHSDLNSYVVIGIGTAYYDLEAKVNNIFLQSLQLEGTEWIKEDNLAKFNDLLEKITRHLAVDSLKATLGGSAGNVVRSLQALGTPSALLCKLGEDPISTQYQRAMGSLNTGVIAQPSTTPVSRILVLIEGGNRKFICNQTLSLDLEPSSLSKDSFKGIKNLHIEGYCINEFQIAYLEKAIEFAKEEGALISFDLGADWVVKNNLDKVYQFISKVDILFANEAEVKVFKEYRTCPPDEEQVATLLLEQCPTIVFLQGERGAQIFSKNDSGSVTSIVSPANSLEEGMEPNTNGAGDAFIAGFLHGLLQNYSLEDSAWIGNLLGGTIIQYDGTQIPQENWGVLRDQINSYLMTKNPLVV